MLNSFNKNKGGKSGVLIRNYDYICKVCNKLNHSSNICNTCRWKENYFGGLYWKVIKNECEKCGRSDIKLNLDHINDNPKDNRIDNFQTLCVECHMKKRLFYCLDCKQPNRATSARQVRCIKCFPKHEQVMSFKRLAKYWKTRNKVRYNWYTNKLKSLK